MNKKKGPKRRKKAAKKKIKRRLEDNPLLRHQSTMSDLFPKDKNIPLGKLRVNGLEHSGKMLPKAPLAEHKFSAPPTSGSSNWVQIGPTAIPGGQTLSTYYYPDFSRQRPTTAIVTGRVTAIVVDPTDPKIIYLGVAQGGVWKTIDGGRNWAAKSDNEISLAIGALAMDPTNHLILYAGTGEGNYAGDSYYGNGLLKTTDGGETWSLYGNDTLNLARFSRLAVNPMTPEIVFAAITSSDNPRVASGVYRSTDGGVNWTRMKTGLPSMRNQGATDIVLDPTNPNIAYAAFYGSGIYKTTQANTDDPLWTKLSVTGLNSNAFSRISLGISPSSPQIIYALVADNSSNDYIVNKFYRTIDGGNSWRSIPLPGRASSSPWEDNSIGGQGFYNLNVAVAPTTPDIVYLSGVSLWKAVRNSATDNWSITDIGKPIHPDNHAFAFDPTNDLVIYAGNDGGIYKSTDGGNSWSDVINEGLCITQFEFMAPHPNSDALVLAGTQDNGTIQFRNNPAFYFSAYGDGGFTAIDPSEPNIFLHQYIHTNLYRSEKAGKIDSWRDIEYSLSGSRCLFYAPFVLDQSNPKNIAFGADRIFLDTNQGLSRWLISITLPNISGDLVSAINYVKSDLIYVGTDGGKVYCLTKEENQWKARAIHASPLPQGMHIWDVATLPGDINTVIVVMAGYYSNDDYGGHVWRGSVPTTGVAQWVDISGERSTQGRLPNVPVNAIAIEEDTPQTMYIGTDTGVFRTNNGGVAWTPFNEGLPNSAVYDMRIHMPTRLLRIVTHGRGMWERKLDVQTMSDIDLFVRDNLMDTGRLTPSPLNVSAAFDDTLQRVSLGDVLTWSMCADIKVDALEGFPPSYQMNVEDVDYIAFESRLYHRDPKRGRINRVYVQVHNRGIKSADNVSIKILYADISAGYPDLPPDFWTAFPGNSADTTKWKPIGEAKVLPSPPKTLTNTEPTILAWEWTTPSNVSDYLGLIVILDSPADPIPGANKIFNIAELVRTEKHVGLKDLSVINV
jgi:photosystem II stability/assembly factor-like uncharacterized protein